MSDDEAYHYPPDLMQLLIQTVPLMGYESLPSASVREKRRSSGTSFNPAAAAVTLSRLAVTNAPALFCTAPIFNFAGSSRA